MHSSADSIRQHVQVDAAAKVKDAYRRIASPYRTIDDTDLYDIYMCACYAVSINRGDRIDPFCLFPSPECANTIRRGPQLLGPTRHVSHLSVFAVGEHVKQR